MTLKELATPWKPTEPTTSEIKADSVPGQKDRCQNGLDEYTYSDWGSELKLFGEL